MAPAPLPADPTLLTSPITDKVSSTILACSSRRILTPVAISAIEESQSQQNSSNDTTKCLQRKANKENETSFVQEFRRRYNRLSLNKVMYDSLKWSSAFSEPPLAPRLVHIYLY